ncbi:30S ribosomal protein S16 [soil metagenome]
MVKLRLKRMGAKKRPSYRIIATESSSPRNGRFIEQVGFYDPLTEPVTVTLNEERINYWLGVGAQPSDTVRGILRRQGLVPDHGPTHPAKTAA